MTERHGNLKCTDCGTPLEDLEGRSVGPCPQCGSRMVTAAAAASSHITVNVAAVGAARVSAAAALRDSLDALRHHLGDENMVLPTVIVAVCWVEALVTELFIDCADGVNDPRTSAIPAPARAEIIKQWERWAHNSRSSASLSWLVRFENAWQRWLHGTPRLAPSNAWKKWKVLLKAAGKHAKKQGPQVAALQLLIELRNECVHAKPTRWPHNDKAVLAFENRLAQHFTLGGSPYFLHKIRVAGCARWAANTAIGFNDHAIVDLLGIPARSKGYEIARF